METMEEKINRISETVQNIYNILTMDMSFQSEEEYSVNYEGRNISLREYRNIISKKELDARLRSINSFEENYGKE